MIKTIVGASIWLTLAALVASAGAHVVEQFAAAARAWAASISTALAN